MACQILTQLHGLHSIFASKVTHLQVLNNCNFAYSIIRTYGSEQFQPKKAVILKKMTRYEFEKTVHKGSTEEELKHYVNKYVNSSLAALQNCNSTGSLGFAFSSSIVQGIAFGTQLTDCRFTVPCMQKTVYILRTKKLHIVLDLLI